MFLRITDYVFDTYLGGVKPDLRTKDWFLVDNAGVLFSATALYLFICTVGPKLMEFSKPFELRRPIMFYNALMVVINSIIFYLAATGGWLTHYKFFCQACGSVDQPISYRMAHATHLMMLSKYVELIDTVFFILRKKKRQITFLHVYHHSTVMYMFWGSARYMPDGHHTLMVLINSWVHVVMYTYYLLSQFGPSMQKYLWWKKYLTRMQLTQFVVVILHSLVLLHPSCNYPPALALLPTVNIFIYFVLFMNFYFKNYTSNKKSEQKGGNTGSMCFADQTKLD